MTSAHPERKQKIKHQLTEMLRIVLYLAFFFCALLIRIFCWPKVYACGEGVQVAELLDPPFPNAKPHASCGRVRTHVICRACGTFWEQ